jgi:hypothetical protein
LNDELFHVKQVRMQAHGAAGAEALPPRRLPESGAGYSAFL